MTRLAALTLSLAVLAGCAARNDLDEPPVALGNFALGLNIVVADNMQMVPISRPATVEDWEAAMKKAVDDRFGRYAGSRLYNIGINIDAYALAPPGVPIVLSPKSVVAISANIWDDATQTRLNPEPVRLTVFESLSGSSFVGSGLSQSPAQQMENLAYNAAKAVEDWLVQNPQWFPADPAQAPQ
ncbi:MAG: hypothetical protein IE927_14535, partial [Rhodobacterales bacterium]|nr:hypothetical protein [Rhodobacterales bacterium]